MQAKKFLTNITVVNNIVYLNNSIVNQEGKMVKIDQLFICELPSHILPSERRIILRLLRGKENLSLPSIALFIQTEFTKLRRALLHDLVLRNDLVKELLSFVSRNEDGSITIADDSLVLPKMAEGHQGSKASVEKPSLEG